MSTTSRPPVRPELDGCVAKLDRAEEIFKGLYEEIRAHPEFQQFELILRPNEDHSYSVLVARPHTLPRLDWGIRLGEVVHDVRSSLDQLVAVLVVEAGARVATNHQFPICDDPDRWSKEVNDRHRLGSVEAAHVATIEAAQPYKRSGLRSLAAVRDLSNTDKHRVIPALRINLQGRPSIANPRWVVPTTLSDVRIPDLPPILEEGAELARLNLSWLHGIDQTDGRIHLPDGTKPDMDLQLKAAVGFGTAEGEPVLMQEVQAAISDCRLLLSRF